VNEAALREHMDSTRTGGYFDASSAWDDERSHDRLWS
jgi:hypothetical protein